MMTQKLALLPLLILILLLTSGLVAAQEQSPYDIALERIEAARDSSATSLDLSYLGLKTLPSELFELSELTDLYLSHNRLSELPYEI
ncbi:MAG: hypothetical protein KC546_14115, partial [Anaerolineae bacterium]|nr:hypothetical protein [Anaerolineae bacterium]